LEDKIEKLYNFLKENRQYNKQVQEGFIKSCIAIDGLTTEQKVLNLLYGVVSTQSQPKMDKIGEFFKNIYENKSKLATYNGFLEVINTKKQSNATLFELLKDCPGWGRKTAALFVKTIYLIHNDITYDEYKFWENSLPKNLQLKLPVDSVITHIFKNSFLQEKKQSTFVGINKFISNLPSENSNVIIWDELWFWGFITQQNLKNLKSQKMERKNIKLNVNKFLCLPYVEKDIFEIEKLANEFFGMIKPKKNE
jgi:hypothetical protein